VQAATGLPTEAAKELLEKAGSVRKAVEIWESEKSK
jgi:hypothetical protein